MVKKLNIKKATTSTSSSAQGEPVV